MTDVTRILSALEQGDPHAAAQLLPLVYDELRKLAAARMAAEAPGQTLQATALVHEAYVRLVEGERRGSAPSEWNSRGHFFAAAAEAMRRILVEQARRRHAIKRGGGVVCQPLDEVELLAPGPDEQVLALHEAVDELAKTDSDAAAIVKLRFFAGMTAAQSADALGISIRSAHDLWAYARTWLHRRMRVD